MRLLPPGPGAVLAACLVAFLVINGVYATWLVSSSEHKWCSTLNLLYAEKPPPGNPRTNPSRAFDQDLHLRFAQLRDQLGCQ